MAGFTERLQILIDGDAQGAIREFKKVGDTAERELDRADIASRNTARNLQAIGTAGIAGSSALLVGLGALAKVSDEADIQTKKLENSIKGSSSTFQDNGGELVKLAENLQQVTAADADAIVGAESLLVQFGLTEDQVKALTPLVVDLSRKLGIDLDTAAKTVGKAVDGNAGALKRYGIVLDENALSADGFGTVLGALQQQVGGFARTEGETFTGQMERLKNNLGDIAENVGAGAADVLGSFVSSAADGAKALNELNPGILNAVGGIGATAGIVGVAVSALTLGAGAAMDFKNNLQEGNTALTKVGENGQVQLTKVGKAAAGIAFVGIAVGIAETVASVANSINDIDVKTAAAFDGLRNNLDGLDVDAAKAFGALVEVEDKSAEFAGIWQGLGAEISLGNFTADIEEADAAFGKVLETLGPQAAQKVIDGLRRQNEALDRNSDQYRTNAEFIDKNQKLTDERRRALENATLAERDQKRAIEESVDAYDRQTGTLEGVNLALKDAQDFVKALGTEYDVNAAKASAFAESLERSTFADDQISAALTFNETLEKGLAFAAALPEEFDAAKIALVGLGDDADGNIRKVVDAFLAVGDASQDFLSTFIQAGDAEGARNFATLLRTQIIEELRQQGITDPQRIDELLGLVGLTEVQIDAAINFANVEGELLRVQTLIALFETALRDAPPQLLLKVSDQILAGDLEGARQDIQSWVSATSDDPATSQVGVEALVTKYPDMAKVIGEAQAEADKKPIKLSFAQSASAIDAIASVYGVIAEADRVILGLQQQATGGLNLPPDVYQELVQNRDINGNGVIGRATGGPVAKGQAYMVGEEGPELFVPRVSGRIISNGQLQMGGSQIIQNITTPDPLQTAAEVVRRQRDAEFLAGV